MTVCSNCGDKVPSHRSNCDCGNFVGFPNVRKAASADEVSTLSQRAAAAWAAASASKSTTILTDFADHVEKSSQAVVCRDLGTLDMLLNSNNNFYINYHRQVRAGNRDPQDNKWDAIRQQVDAALFPNYFDHIFFACLSLDGNGDDNYGLYFCRLKDTMIRMRSSVFEENSIVFADRHKLRLSDPIPPGYRAPWTGRQALAVSKLHNQITPTTTASEFPGILFTPGKQGDAEFIEVHIFGRLGANAIESVSAAKPLSNEDRILWRRVQRRLTSLGIAVEER